MDPLSLLDLWPAGRRAAAGERGAQRSVWVLSPGRRAFCCSLPQRAARSAQARRQPAARRRRTVGAHDLAQLDDVVSQQRVQQPVLASGQLGQDLDLADGGDGEALLLVLHLDLLHRHLLAAGLVPRAVHLAVGALPQRHQPVVGVLDATAPAKVGVVAGARVGELQLPLGGHQRVLGGRPPAAGRPRRRRRHCCLPVRARA